MLKYIYIPGWCNGSTSASGAFSLGSSPSPGVMILQSFTGHGSMVERSLWEREVPGSSPGAPIFLGGRCRQKFSNKQAFYLPILYS